MNLRKKAETVAASAEEKSNRLEGELRSLSESAEREKNRLHKELIQLKTEARLSVSRISADVSSLSFLRLNILCLHVS